jgi:hypothetical protein
MTHHGAKKNPTKTHSIEQSTNQSHNNYSLFLNTGVRPSENTRNKVSPEGGRSSNGCYGTAYGAFVHASSRVTS